MRKTIIALVALMALLMLNIIAYSLSENYRFLIKKMKYPSEIVYENEEEIDDTKKIEVLSGTTENQSNYKDISGSSFQFLNEFRKNDTESEDTLRELSSEEKEFLALWEDSKLEEIHFSTYVFDVTDEYPDPYYEWYSENLELYVFPTKNYEEIKNIFEVLSHDLPYSIKETNNFGEKSFYINLKNPEMEPRIRIVLQYKNKVFGLKIKKDAYNDAKTLLEQL